MATPIEHRVIGTHRIQIEGDIVFLIQEGDYPVEDAHKPHAEIEAVLGKLGRAFILVDQTHGGQTTSAARKAITEWNKKHKASGAAIFGGGIATRAAATLVVSAVRLFRPDTMPTVFTQNEAEGRAWIAAQRAKLATRS
jgi:hypothetical protein